MRLEPHLSPELRAIGIHALLVLVGVASGFLNTLAGGASIITVPALMLTGIPGDIANATGRLGIVTQSLTATVTSARAGLLTKESVLELVPITLVGALAGAYVATIVPNKVFEPVLIGTMIVMAFAMLVRSETLVPKEGETPKRLRERPIAVLALLVAGFYGGVLQAGAGFVLLALFGGLLRYDLVRGNALKVVVVFAYTLVAVGVFIARGRIAWVPGLCVAAGSIVGALLAVRFSIKKGQGAVKKIVLAMVLVSCVVLLVRSLS